MSTIIISSVMLLAVVALFFILFKVIKFTNAEKAKQATTNIVNVPSREKITLLRQYYKNTGKPMRQATLLENTDYVLNKLFDKNEQK
jgi:hypothetical protein